MCFSGQFIGTCRARQIRGQVDDLEAEIVKGKEKRQRLNIQLKKGNSVRSFKTDTSLSPKVPERFNLNCELLGSKP